mgnify:CR=1 FL=1
MMPVGAAADSKYSVNNNDTTAKNSLDKNAFLKLLITELRYQDAMNPMNDREFMSQMAQMSSLEQMQNLNKTVEEGFLAMAESRNNLEEGLFTVMEVMINQSYFTNFNQSMNLLGREVTYLSGDQEIEGTVTALKQVDGCFLAVVNGEEVALTQITLVK